MISLYLAMLAFGGVLLGASLFLGGHGDGDADHDTDHDTDHDAADHAHPESKLDSVGDAVWTPFLSLRFWIFAAFAFGLGGALLTLLGVHEPITAAVATPLGLGVGFAASRFFQRLNRDNVTGDTSFARFAGEEAKVVIAVRPGSTGKIAIETQAGRVEIPAITRDGRALEAGARVLVASVTQGVADVSGLHQLEARAKAPETER